MAQVYMSLGGNVGDRVQNLQRAISGIADFATVTQQSPVYETEPWGPIADQPYFLNMCLSAASSLTPEALLGAIKTLEQDLGRDTSTRWGPHNIDIDLLFYDDLVAQFGKKHIPHPGVRKRAFVLVPLADIAADYVHPVHKLTVREMLDEISTTGIVPYEMDPVYLNQWKTLYE